VSKNTAQDMLAKNYPGKWRVDTKLPRNSLDKFLDLSLKRILIL